MSTRARPLPSLAGLLGLCLLVLLIWACAGGLRGALPLPEELAAQGRLPAGADLAALSRGRRLALANCASCHRFYWPEEYDAAAWERILPEMGDRASLSPEQTALVREYFLAVTRPVEGATQAAD
jgi:hypothetical protein